MKFLKCITIILFIISSLLLGVGKYFNSKKDVTPPIITSDLTEISVYSNYTDDDLKIDLQAYDNVDGDITSNIIVGKLTPFSSIGKSTVKYVVFDSNNNVGEYERTVSFIDYESPKLSLTKPLVYKRGDNILVSDRLFVNDCIEGDISSKLKYASPDLIQSEVGTYNLTAEVTNSFGDNLQISLPINIVSYNTDREMIKLKEYLIYAKVGSTINPLDYVDSIENVDSSLLNDVSIFVSEYADLTKPGTSQYKFELRIKESILSVTFLTVIVIE